MIDFNIIRNRVILIFPPLAICVICATCFNICNLFDYRAPDWSLALYFIGAVWLLVGAAFLAFTSDENLRVRFTRFGKLTLVGVFITVVLLIAAYIP